MPAEPGADLAREIAGQPALWQLAAVRGAGLRARPGAVAALPPDGLRLAVIGCGTSLYVARAVAALRESAGAGETDAFTPTELPPRRSYDALLALSRSGTTSEVLEAVSRHPGTPVYAVCGDTDSPLSAAASHVVTLAEAAEPGVVQTRFATTVLAMTRAYLGTDLTAAIDDARRALADPLPVDPAEHGHFVFLGRGWTVGLAQEAALKIQEMAAVVAEAYPAPEYLHGPLGAAAPGTVVWSLDCADPLVLAAARRAGARVLDRPADPLAELVAVHRVAHALARVRGLDPAHPRNLTRSVIRPPASAG
ncbi:SIS domain-containing protein [Nocardia thailandica]|uniref:SIS domain-containing protein n=1 Tax=Nocardia thailandica TaxID=257275 RepID=UPI00031DB30F|nr:SIS domain-containing protein [Nocardia thailandica]